jgi:hypothetical protein
MKGWTEGLVIGEGQSLHYSIAESCFKQELKTRLPLEGHLA